MLEFKVDDIYKADAIGHATRRRRGQGLHGHQLDGAEQALFQRLRLERLVTFITIGLIVFVAALNILISLIMMVMEKTKDIAVLMSMGTRKAQVRNVFIAQGLLIGVIGTAIGLVLGYALSYAGGHYHLISLVAGGLLDRLRAVCPAVAMACWSRSLRFWFRLSRRCIRRGRRQASCRPRPCATNKSAQLTASDSDHMKDSATACRVL